MPAHTPSPSLLAALDAELVRHVPFAYMAPAQRLRFLAAAEQLYFAPDEVLLEPASGPVSHLYAVRLGGVHGSQRLGDPSPFELDAGELFPVSAMLAQRAVTATYRARGDTFCLRVPAAVVRELIAESPPFSDFVNRRMLQLLELSQRAQQSGAVSRVLAEQSLQAPLADFVRGAPLAVAPQTPLATALKQMLDRGVGSVLVTGPNGEVLGILTRHDVLGRITLAGRPLDTPIATVMSQPVHTLSVRDRAHDAALLMSREGVRHVPITDSGRVVGIVSERDLFALQRLSLRQIGGAVAGADSIDALRQVAADIRHFASQLLAQGVGARQLTELISHLNDLLTTRLIELVAARHGVDLARACWLAFGSEGRSEQTIATDQDNGIVFDSDDAERDRPAWLAFGREVNAELDACGYPLCSGNIMAGNPACCLTQQEWLARFGHWIEHGAPADLLAASIYFDVRPLAGNAALAAPLRDFVTREAQGVPRFIKQMADNALRNRAPLDWKGAIATRDVDGQALLDLKLSGTAIFVDVARLYALAHGVAETNTRRRFQAVAPHLHAGPQESEGWCTSFEFLQMQRLHAQLRSSNRPNLIDPNELNDVDRRVLRECIRVMRRLQQRVELDFPG